MNKHYNCIAMFIIALLFAANNMFAQAGSTTAAMNGRIVDQNGNPLPGANIIAVHLPTGSIFGSTSRDDGKFNLLSLRTGGPYKVTVSFVGYTTQEQENIYLKLSQNLAIDFVLPETTFELEGVTVTSERNAILSEARTGAAQNVGQKEIQSVPTISRSFSSFAKLSPQVSGTGGSNATGNRIGGNSNRYNNIQIDGAQNNDLFGLGATGAPGGQTNTNPISLDAIEEFQVVVAPYDVKLGGFTGGGINAITRSGTNNWHGSVFGFGRNESFVGNAAWIPEGEPNHEFPEFQEFQYGFRVGGPIQKDKIFIFVSGEQTINDRPRSNDAITQGDFGALASRVEGILASKYGNIGQGGFGSYTTEQPSQKLFVRVDWNINNNHKLTLRHNYVDATRDILNSRNSLTQMSTADFTYDINSVTNSTVLQLNSTFSNNMSNQLIVGFSTIRDKRAGIFGANPSIQIDEPGVRIRVGPDQFSSANRLDQDIFEITDDFTILSGDHVFTIGTHNEFFSFTNLFIRNFFGFYRFANVDDFEAMIPSRFERSFSRVDDPQPAAEFDVAQFGFYIQDEWQVNDKFKLTAGLRVDIPTFPEAPANNPLVSQFFPGKTTTQIPDGNLLWSPRIGFNYDIFGDRSTQMRGGAGIFTGRIPYVWMSNNYGNTGTTISDVSVRNPDPSILSLDPNNQPGPGLPGISNTAEINLVDPDFQMPQVLRFNIGVDKQLPFGFVGTAELIYTKNINALLYRKLNLNPPTKNLGNAGTATDSRPVYGRNDSKDGNFTRVLELYNTSGGYATNLSFQLQRNVLSGLSVNVGYNYQVSKDRNSVNSSQARSQMRDNPIGIDPNNPDLTTSLHEIPHRIFGAFSYTKEFFKNAETTISLYYNGQSGSPITFLVAGDVNNDAFDRNDLFYIPRNSSEILLGSINDEQYVRAPQSHYDRLESFIQSDEYLREHRGQISERNGSKAPWRHILDFRIAQVIPFIEGHSVQLTLDVLNVLNLIDKTWGKSRTLAFNTTNVTRYVGDDPDSGAPVYRLFAPEDVDNIFAESDLSSRWQMQFGVRYSF